MNLQKTSLWIVAILFVVSLVVSATRELNILCVRLLFHLNGKTYVQGQPSGCIVYLIPNVRFADDYRKELRIHSADSPDNYVLAGEGGNFLNPIPPAAVDWNGHPLLIWSALRQAWTSSFLESDAGLTNSISMNTNVFAYSSIARDVVKLAQTSDADNGALWLAAAALDFGEKKDDAALDNLEIAGIKSNWDATAKTSFNYMAGLFEKAGLPRLDAVIDANNQLPDTYALAICGIIKQSLDNQLLEAVKKDDGQKFSSLFQILVKLRGANWKHSTVSLYNTFRNFSPSGDLVKAIAKKMGRGLPSTNDRAFEEQLFDDYVKSHTDLQTAERFLTQQKSALKEMEAIHGKREAQANAVLLYALRYQVFAVLALVMLSLFIVAALFEVPFWKLRRDKCMPGILPKQGIFWFLSSAMVILGFATMVNFFTSLGANSEVGLRASGSSSISPLAELLAISFALSFLWFAILLYNWKSGRTLLKSQWTLLIFAGLYFVFIFVAAYFRHQMVAELVARF